MYLCEDYMATELLLVEWSFTISTTTSQPSCKVTNTLHKLPQLCDNLTKLQQGCYNLVISIWVGSIFTNPVTYRSIAI